jgi:tetraacyldisaccharide 4'-kinase
MSRGYGRKTKGFLLAHDNISAYEIGDEPLQYARKFDDIVVSVAENRGMGIPKLLSHHPEVETVLLDDAFQHRSIEPGLNILLTEFSKPYYADFLMPTGRLREWASGAKRADAVIVSKCPEKVSLDQMEEIKKKLNLQNHQELFFSYYKYLRPYNIFNPAQAIHLSDFDSVFLVSAIANTDYLLGYLESQGLEVYDLSFEDHHQFSNYEISNIIRRFEEQKGEKKILLTTEKDAMRLELHKGYFLEKDTQVFALPIEVRFHEFQGAFDDYIKDYLLNVKV